MEICAVNVMPDVSKMPPADKISCNVSQEKKQSESLPDQGVRDNSKDVAPSEEEIAKAIKEINKTLALHSTRLEFSIHEQTKEIMVKVVDEKTGDVLREVPSKKALDMVAMAWDEIGLLLDEKA